MNDSLIKTQLLYTFKVVNEALNPNIKIIDAREAEFTFREFDNLPPTVPTSYQLPDIQITVDTLRQSLTAKNSTYEWFVQPVSTHNSGAYFIVLSLDKQMYDSLPRLTEYNYYNMRMLKRSLTDCIIDEFLLTLAEVLQNSNLRLKSLRLSPSAIILRAAQEFMYSIVDRLDITAIIAESPYEVINRISTMKYEGADNISSLLIGNNANEEIHTAIKFQNSLEFSNPRNTRKLLEVSNKSLSLFTDLNSIYGFSDTLDKDIKVENIFRINFTGHYKWQLCHKGILQLSVEYGQPVFPRKAAIDLSELLGALITCFGEAPYNKLLELAEAAAKQKHGTMLIISDNVESEVIRLSSPMANIEQFELTSALAERITSIDGALFIDKEGLCHGFGIILDGVANGSGVQERGARYNSALRYLEYAENAKIPTVVIIVSEDKTIDIKFTDFTPKANAFEWLSPKTD